MNRRYFFKSIIGAATLLGTAPGLFLPKLEKPVWKPSFREIIVFNRQWNDAPYQVGIIPGCGVAQVFSRSTTTLHEMAKYERFCKGGLPIRGNFDTFGKFTPVTPFVALRVKGDFKPKAYYF